MRKVRGMFRANAIARVGFFASLRTCDGLWTEIKEARGDEGAGLKDLVRSEVEYARFMRRRDVDFPRIP